jgi:hypothetical protein
MLTTHQQIRAITTLISTTTTNTNERTTNTSIISNNTSKIANNTTTISTNRNNRISNQNNRTINTNDLQTAASKLATLQGQLDNCMNVSLYCYPQVPSVTLNCFECTEQGSAPSFSGIATATISNCRQGCSYRWVNTNSANLSFTECSNGTVIAGGSARPTCKVSSNLSPQDNGYGTFKIEVSNSKDTSLKDTASTAVSYKNTKADDISIAENMSIDCSKCESHGSSYRKGPLFVESKVIISFTNNLQSPQYTIDAINRQCVTTGQVNGGPATVDLVNETYTLRLFNAGTNSGEIECDVTYRYTVTATGSQPYTFSVSLFVSGRVVR